MLQTYGNGAKKPTKQSEISEKVILGHWLGTANNASVAIVSKLSFRLVKYRNLLISSKM